MNQSAQEQNSQGNNSKSSYDDFRIAQFNAHQEDVRRRADSLCRAIFLLSGGALTLTVGAFLSGNAPILPCQAISILKLTWWALSYSIVSLASSLFAIIIRDYFNGERLRVSLKSGEGKFKEITAWEPVIWFFAVTGFAAFITGYVGLAYVASSLAEAKI